MFCFRFFLKLFHYKWLEKCLPVFVALLPRITFCIALFNWHAHLDKTKCIRVNIHQITTLWHLEAGSERERERDERMKSVRQWNILKIPIIFIFLYIFFLLSYIICVYIHFACLILQSCKCTEHTKHHKWFKCKFCSSSYFRSPFFSCVWVVLLCTIS